MEMESTRRSFDRSISKEPGLKKARLTEDHAAAPQRSAGDRAGLVQRPVHANSGGGSRLQREQDSARGAYQHQPGNNQLHQELVNQYKTALSELTFNSKPIITNLTIIAGENLHSAKAIAATVCSNILEVPREQKLPSLYLLDSIVKNIGRDYIKYFASKLPEVFCKVYKQVDPSIHQGMRHLFGTWKGVFPQHILQMIEKELGFTTTANGSSSGKTPSRPDQQAQRPANSIHVNPKYLEARQRLQTTRARGPGSDTSGSIVSAHEVEASERTTISSERLSGDPYAKSIHHQYKDKVNEAVRDKSPSLPYLESEYGSSVPGSLGLGARKVGENFKEQGLDMSWCESGSNATGKVFNIKNGLHTQLGRQSASSNSQLQLKQRSASRAPNGVSQSWDSSEEEEYVWDGMIVGSTERYAADTPAKDISIIDNIEKLDFDSHFQRPQSLHRSGSGVPDEASADSIAGTQIPLSEGDMLLDPGQNISSYMQGYSSELKSLASALVRKPFQSQQNRAPVMGQNSKFSADVVEGLKLSVAQQNFGAASTQSGMHQCSPSPSLSAHNQNKLPYDSAERKQTSTGPPKDPRRPPRQRNMGSHDQVLQGSPMSSRDAYEPSTKKFTAQSSQTSCVATATHSLQPRKPLPPQKRKLEESSDGEKLLGVQISGSGSPSMKCNSSPDQLKPHTVDSLGQSLTSSLLTAAVKSGILGSISLIGGPYKLGSQEVGLGSSPQGALPPVSSSSPPGLMSSQPSNGNMLLPGPTHTKPEPSTFPPDSPSSSLGGINSEQAPSIGNSMSDPVSSLLSSLVAKGLISSSKSDSLSSASTQISNQPLDRCPEVSNTSPTPDFSTPVTTDKPVLSVTDEPSASKPAANDSDGLLQSTREIKSLIGFEFRSDIIRTLHPDVLNDLLSDLPYQCSTCGLRLKFQESFDKHMEWHAVRIPEQQPLDKNSRMWYANVVNWVTGVDHFPSGDSPSDLLAESGVALESSEPMVPADESQCACILCGELFDDFYSQERNEWMFKGAVYLSDPSSESHEMIRTASDTSCLGPIVHVNCMSQDFVPSFGLA